MKITIATLFLLLSASLTSDAQVNFSGTWIRHTEQCDPGGLSINSIPIEIKIQQNPGGLAITRTSKNRDGEITAYTENLKFDGSTSKSVVKPGLNKNATVKWSDDKKTLTESADYQDDDGNTIQKATEVWTINNDGKIINDQSTLEINEQSLTLKEVFGKK